MGWGVLVELLKELTWHSVNSRWTNFHVLSVEVGVMTAVFREKHQWLALDGTINRPDFIHDGDRDPTDPTA